MRAAIRSLALATALAAVFAAAPAAAGSAAQVYYVPLPEDQVHAALRAVFPGGSACGTGSGAEVGDPIYTYLSIAPVAAGTVIVYDHWEDGYEPDLTRPAQQSTEVWGDGDAANGIPPGFAADEIGVGDVVVLHNPVGIGDRGAVLDFDGGDKLAASAPVSVTRAAWASGTRTLLAGAVDVRELREWGRSYRSPVGEDVDATGMFEYAALAVMASRDGTRVEVDADADGTPETSVTLDEGRSHLVPGGVLAGAAVAASEPVQVALVTGDVCARYQSRWFALEPAHRWSGSAYAPVGTPPDHPTTVFVFNPGAAAVSVVQESRTATSPAVAIAPGGVHPFAVPEGSGSRFVSTGGEPILAVGTVDTGGSAHEWGFSLVPEPFLTPQALTGWGAGRDPLSAVNPGENGSPVWVTPVLPGGGRGNVAVCVDFDGDNAAGGAGGGIDDAGFHYDLRLNLQPLESARIFDEDGDQTGMIVYVCDDSGARLAVAWGQDPSAASPASPGLDLGTTVPPLPSLTAAKDVELAVDADGDSLADPGDTLRYVIGVRNVSRRPVTGLVVSDELPAHTTYVAGSARVDDGSGPATLADAGGTGFPLDEGGASVGTLQPGAALAISFLAVIDELLPEDVLTVRNVAIVRSDAGEIEVEAVLPLAPWEPRPSLRLEKLAKVETSGSPGTGTIGYWKNHPEAWPAAGIVVGGVTCGRDEALALMGTPGRGDKTYDLFRQLVAARLNVLAGNDASCIAAALAAADAWLAAHPVGSGVRSRAQAWRDAGAALHATLDDYNNGLLCAPHRDTVAAEEIILDVVFTLVVTNTGNVDLVGVSVEDAAMPACNAVLEVLPAFGESVSLTCRAEGVRGDFVNEAVAGVTGPDDLRIEARSAVFVDLPGGGNGGGTPGGVRSLAHWNARPEAWPVSELTLGGGTRTREGIRGVLDRCRRDDPACALFGQLAAARLNLLGGADPSCAERAVGAADSWLASHPPGSGVRAKSAAWRKGGKRLHDLLARYNRGLLCAPPAAP